MAEREQSSSIETDARRAANADHAWTLMRWVGIPILLVTALYFIQRTYDERPYVVVTDRGAMPSPEEIAARPATAPPAQPPVTGQPIAPPVPPMPLAPAPPPEPDVALRAISQPSPPYPSRALNAEKEGIVRLRLTISPDGEVSDAVALRSEPPGWFERAAESGARRWRYAPPGRAVTTEVDVEFKLN